MPAILGNPDSELNGNFALIKEVDNQDIGLKEVSEGLIATADCAVGHLTRKTIQIANSAVLTLPTTPVSLVAAPGANIVNYLDKAIIRLKYTGSYTNIDAAGTLRIKRGSDVISSAILNNAGASITDLTTLLTGSKVCIIERLQRLNTTLNNLPNLLTYAANEALTLDLSNGASGNLTGGNSANIIIVVLYYWQFDFTGI